MRLMGFSRIFTATLAVVCMALACSSAGAQERYPSRPVKLVVPFPPGGPTDVFGRLVAAKLSGVVGQQVVVDNRPGASGIVGTEHVAKSQPDGYTLLFGTAATHAINVKLYKNLPYDPLKDFELIAFVGVVPQVLLVHPSLPGDLKELLALLKANPRKYTYGSAGSGTTTHLSMELLKSAANVSALHVPYKGSGPALNDVIGGQIHFMFESFGTALQHIKSGRLKAVAVANKQRSTAAPEVPTFEEAGLPGFEAATWNIVAAPAGTPTAIVERLNRATNEVMRDPEIKKRLFGIGIQGVDDSTPATTVETVRREMLKWAKAVEISGAKID